MDGCGEPPLSLPSFSFFSSSLFFGDSSLFSSSFFDSTSSSGPDTSASAVNSLGEETCGLGKTRAIGFTFGGWGEWRCGWTRATLGDLVVGDIKENGWGAGLRGGERNWGGRRGPMNFRSFVAGVLE